MPMMMGVFGVGWWWVFPLAGLVMMAGMLGVVVPRILRQSSHRGNEPPPPRDPLVLARERYAEGRISKSELDDLVQALLKTEEGLDKGDVLRR